ncbi:MAG: NifU family protein [Bacteroidota bacterium]
MIYTEITPNPASLKFVVGQTLMAQGSADFPTVEETTEAPIARKLFDFKFVERVFLGYNFITITKGDDFQWEEIIPVVKDFLKAYFASGQEIITGSLAEQSQAAPDPEEGELVGKIKEVLQNYVRPAVAQDGGDIVYDSFENGTLKLRMQGSCSGCPSSTLTLKSGIEGLMSRMVPEVKVVEAV